MSRGDGRVLLLFWSAGITPSTSKKKKKANEDKETSFYYQSPLVCSLRQLPHTRRAVGSSWLCGAHRACSCSGMRNSWQFRPRHAQQCVPHNQPTPCMRSVRSTQSAAFMVLRWTRVQWQGIAGMSAGIWSLRQAVALRARILTWALAAPTALQKHCPHGRPHYFVAGTRRCASSTVWIATSFRPHPRMPMQLIFCPHPRMLLQLHALCALHTASSFPPLASCASGNRLTVAAPRHGAAAPHRAVMDIKRRPVERPVEHACAAAPRAPRN